LTTSGNKTPQKIIILIEIEILKILFGDTLLNHAVSQHIVDLKCVLIYASVINPQCLTMNSYPENIIGLIIEHADC
jgi:hypothetical protein